MNYLGYGISLNRDLEVHRKSVNPDGAAQGELRIANRWTPEEAAPNFRPGSPAVEGVADVVACCQARERPQAIEGVGLTTAVSSHQQGEVVDRKVGATEALEGREVNGFQGRSGSLGHGRMLRR